MLDKVQAAVPRLGISPLKPKGRLWVIVGSSAPLCLTSEKRRQTDIRTGTSAKRPTADLELLAAERRFRAMSCHSVCNAHPATARRF